MTCSLTMAWRLLSVCVCVCLCVRTEVRALHVPAKMNRTIQSLLQHYKSSRVEAFNGKPVFPKYLSTGEAETRMVYLGGVLHTYDSLLSHMLERLPTPGPQDVATPPSTASRSASVRSELNYILMMVRNLKQAYFQEQETLMQQLLELGRIPMDNQVVQSKALRELPRLYLEASMLSKGLQQQQQQQQQRRRRRRQTRDRKLPLA